MLELHSELESKEAKWYATIDIANAFFSIPLAAECRPQFAFTWRGVQYTWNRLPQGWKHSPTICHGLIQTALEKGGDPEHLQYIDDIIVWGDTAEVFEKGEKVIQILLEAGFAIKRGKVMGPAQEIQFLGIKWQDGRCQIPMDVINKITAIAVVWGNGPNCVIQFTVVSCKSKTASQNFMVLYRRLISICMIEVMEMLDSDFTIADRVPFISMRKLLQFVLDEGTWKDCLPSDS
ncbi:hypothetical protein llap_18445 [Limosa lapponica baueri]|uniref:ribonuclease H n=1 Tax=Limosa lapponica baueri TaxID=1758121 RepID=A0A2I0TBW6_LIMLA|nr:hypothetical protein llap_18445 [Limosa lapponica baueri]